MDHSRQSMDGSEIQKKSLPSFLRSKWFKVLGVILLLQVIGYFLGKQDLGRMAVGESPRFSSTFGFLIFDGGSADYGGLGYTISYRLEPLQYRTKDHDIAHIQLWYWIPFLNFPSTQDYFIHRMEIAHIEKRREPK